MPPIFAITIWTKRCPRALNAVALVRLAHERGMWARRLPRYYPRRPLLVLPTGSDLDGFYFSPGVQWMMSGRRVATLIISRPDDGTTQASLKLHPMSFLILGILPTLFCVMSVLMFTHGGVGSVGAWLMVSVGVFWGPTALIACVLYMTIREIRQLLRYWAEATVTQE